MKNVFNQTDASELINRVYKLTPTTQRQWGKMTVAQMLAHCNIAYEMVYEDKHPKPNAFMKFILKNFVKGIIVSEKPYKHNSRTAPQFLVKDDKNFEAEKKRLIDHITKTQQFGEAHFDGKKSHSLGVLSKGEWNNMFYKHLDHHLTQFSV